MTSASVLPFLAALQKQVFAPDNAGSAPGPAPVQQNFEGQPFNAQMPQPQQQPIPDAPPPVPRDLSTVDFPQNAPTVAPPPETKGHMLLRLLQSGIQGGLAGVAANAQTYAQTGRNAGFGGGYQGAFQMPFQQAYQRGQLAQQSAQTEMLKAQSQMVQTPYGQMPMGFAKLLFPALARAQGTIGAAQVGAQGRTQAAQIGAQAKLDAIALQTKIMSQKGAKFIPDVDETGQQFYHVMNPMGQEIGRSDVNVIPSLMTKTSDSVEYRDDGNGNIIALPKRTVSRPNIPGAGGAGSPARGGTASSSGPAAAGTPGGPRVVAKGKPVSMVVGTDSQGRQVAGTPTEMQQAGVTNYTKLDSGESAKVNTARQMTSPGGLFDLIDKDLARFQPGELEALGPRWNEFLAGQVGTADSRYVALRTHVNGLLSTALMQAHVGARGGERIMEHFENIANAGKMSLPTLKAALDAERQYVQEKAMRPVPVNQRGGGYTPPAGAPTATGKNGHKIVYDSGKWVDAATGAPIQ